MNGRTPLVRTTRSFTSDIYRVIIDNHISPFMHDIYDESECLVLQEDNCGPQKQLKSLRIYRMKKLHG